MWITLNVADISCLQAMLCHYPELVSDPSDTHWRAPWLSSLPSSRFQQRISGQRQTNRKRELDWRVQQELLKRVDNSMLHSSRRPPPAFLAVKIASRPYLSSTDSQR